MNFPYYCNTIYLIIMIIGVLQYNKNIGLFWQGLEAYSDSEIPKIVEFMIAKLNTL